MSPGQAFYLVLFLAAEAAFLVLMLTLIRVRRFALRRGAAPTSRRLRVLIGVNIASFALVIVSLPVVLAFILTAG